uniref:Coiled-coil-helix-coiled-coil-helix domain-containing protein 8-like protein n=1 Tax=Callorhinchus milii TaxID=7868 RepID=V9LBD9_CALMI
MTDGTFRGHTWTKPAARTEEEEEDPVDMMVMKTGCAGLHHAVQECMAEHRDWRQCQGALGEFKHCMSEQQARRAEELRSRRAAQGTSS